MTSHHFGIRFILVSLVFPLVVAAVGIVVTLSWLSSAPTRVAVHWNVAGAADGFGSPTSFPLLIALTSVPVTLLFAGILALTGSRHHVGRGTKLIAVAPAWLAFTVGLPVVGALGRQLGMRDASHAPAPVPYLIAGVVAGTVVATAFWFVLPKAVRPGEASPTVAGSAVALAPGERAVWLRTASVSGRFAWAFVGLGILLFGGVTFTVVASGGTRWPLLLIPVVILVLLIGTFSWTVRVDARGLTVRSVYGIPVFRVPADEVTSAGVTRVEALADFGGLGIRFGLSHQFGIILRSGEALEVKRAGGRAFVVTVDDAASAAGLLEALAARTHADSGVS